MRGGNTRFKKGPDPRRAKGRPAGVPNKVTRAVKDFLTDLTSDPDVQEAVRAQIVSGDRGSMQAFLGATHLVIGSPKATVEIGLTPNMGNLLALALKGRNTEPKKKVS